MSNTHLLLLCR